MTTMATLPISWRFLDANGLRLAYCDYGGDGAPLLALHGHFGRGSLFGELAAALGKHWHVIGLDQRGHGCSEHAADYTREGYVEDAAAAIRQLGMGPAVVYGHSLGGVNAYQLAARHPELVRAFIVEDIGAFCHDDASWVRRWPRRFPTIRAVHDYFGRNGRLDTYFLESLVEYDDGWGFRFEPEEIIRSQRLLNGDFWADWLGSPHPALLLHGNRSDVMTTAHARWMAARRPHTRLVEFPTCGHHIRTVEPAACYAVVREFLSELQPLPVTPPA